MRRSGAQRVFDSTTDLNVLKNKSAKAANNRVQWVIAVNEQHKRRIKQGVCAPDTRSEMTTKGKMLTTIWATTKISNGKLPGQTKCKMLRASCRYPL